MSDLFNQERDQERDQYRQEYHRQQQMLAQEKSRKRIPWIIGAIVVAVLAMGSCSSYNGLVGKREGVRKQWSQVENVMQRRADLIPNLVATVKGITKQESDIFVRVAEARSKLLSPTATPTEKVQADQQLSQFRVQVLSLAEQYPQLKSSESFNRLMDELAGSENRIAQERRVYNQIVEDYNVSTSTFPTVLVANLFGFEREQDYFKAAEGAKEVPKVDFQ
jgi:LemA protein